jgi:hypothetical protein
MDALLFFKDFLYILPWADNTDRWMPRAARKSILDNSLRRNAIPRRLGPIAVTTTGSGPHGQSLAVQSDTEFTCKESL